MRLGLVTIGQSPRDDLQTFFARMQSQGIDFVQIGALDGADDRVLAGLAPVAREEFFVTRLGDGRVVRLSRERILPRTQQCVDRIVSEGASVVGVLCTGPFPGFTSSVPLLLPELLLREVVRTIWRRAQLGVVVPTPEQFGFTRQKWAAYPELALRAANPYGTGEQFETVATTLPHGELVVLDGMAYSDEMRRAVQRVTRGPVLLPQALLAALIELLVVT